jgi:hypothetical protein
MPGRPVIPTATAERTMNNVIFTAFSPFRERLGYRSGRYFSGNSR